MDIRYIPTGNEFISLPCINQATAGIEDFTVLHMGYKGMLDVTGNAETPLFQPTISCDGVPVSLANCEWHREHYWTPVFACQTETLSVAGTILSPIGERGYVLRLQATNLSHKSVSVALGMSGLWHKTRHAVNEDKDIKGDMHTYMTNWSDCPVFDLRIGVPVLAFAPMGSLPMTWQTEQSAKGIQYNGAATQQIAAGDCMTLDLFWGFGFEEVAAVTSAKEMLRQTYETLAAKTAEWLTKRQKTVGDAKLDEVLNTNLFFNLFFATGITIDTEELALVTSRSPRYYVSAAYWDRDSLLWSFPSVLLVDADHARAMLEHVFTRQIRNAGVHSRYIDGTVLEPGFELDELCAPVLALSRYVKHTGDRDILRETHIEKGVKHILKVLATKLEPTLGLYETFLQPTDDMRVYPYITYDNVLVWRILSDLATLYQGHWQADTLSVLAEAAERVKAAIATHCVKQYQGANIYAWSVDTEGRWDVYDEPPGSLQLLPFLGFCSPEDSVWQNTVAVIRNPAYEFSFADKPFADIGCPHAPHPWILSVGNSLLCGRVAEAKSILLRSTMDNGIACESIDEITGVSATGNAFATCAGFLTYCMMEAMGG